MGVDPEDLGPCGAEDLQPSRPDNRPRLAAIDYRIGTQPEFLERMEWRIPRQTVSQGGGGTLKPLAPLRTRESSDPTLALMDAFACSLDVLSFYSERIANEGYLGTAVQRRSMVELTRAIGYQLAPGVAASVQLSFTVEDSDDPYRAVDIAAGVQAMSVPQAKGELPQVFETVESILARAEWNAMPVRTEHDQNLSLYWNSADPADEKNGHLYLFDLDNSFDADEESDPELETFADSAALDRYFPLDPGLDLDAALAKRIQDYAYNPDIEPVLKAVPVDETFLRGVGLGLKPGQRIVVIGVRVDEEDERHVACGLLRIVAATEDRAYGVTILEALPHGSPPRAVRRAPRLRLPRLKLPRMPTQRIAFNTASVTSVVREAAWSGDALSALVRTQAWPRAKLMQILRMPRVVVAPETTEAVPGLYLLRDDTGFFGGTAPRQEQLAAPTTGPYAKAWDGSGGRTIWTDSQGALLTGGIHVFLDREMKELVPNGWAAIETPDSKVEIFRVGRAAAQSRADYSMTGKATGVTFARPDGSAVVPPSEKETSPLNAFRFRTARFYGASESLTLAGTPIREDVAAGDLTIDLESLYLDIERGRAVSISGDRSDAESITDSEALTVADVVHIGGHTRLLLETGPDYSYVRSSVRVNANLALATHGELFSETLGSGDSSRTNQTFSLAKKPLTFVSAATPEGRASTLEVRVDGVLWHEIASLDDAGPYDRVYEVRIDDDASTRVRFGDGERGHRLPTGSLNVAASYRAGIGAAGEVPDEAIILLKTRPLGVRAVVNPSPASGSAEPETLDEARARAPQSVRTLGRIVSVTDYQDFALAFAGIGKARADTLWSGEQQIVHLTVAPATDSLMDEEATVLDSLGSAIDLVRDGTDKVVLAPYSRRYFQLSARLYKNADYLAEDVAAEAREALLAGFGYAARDLARPVSAAEAVALLQAVPGVVGVDLDVLAAIEGNDPDAAGPGTLATVLPAYPAHLLPAEEGGGTAPAELLTILDSAIDLIVEEAHA
jgi:phage-related baseplate assembly protein